MKVRVSLAQVNPTSGDLRGNTGKILEAIHQGLEQGADLVVLPEMALTGYCLDEKLLNSLRFLRENRRILDEEIVPECRGLTVVVGFVDADEDQRGADGHPYRYNAAAVIENGRILQIVHKRLLPAYRYFDDKRYFRAGQTIEPVTIATGGGSMKLGVLICEDLWDEGYDLKPCQRYAEQGAELLVCINASPFVGSTPGTMDGKRFVRERLLRNQIKRNGLPICYINTVGVGDNGKNIIPFDGQSMAYDNQGKRVASLAAFAEDQQTIQFDGGTAPPAGEPDFDREAEIYDALVMSVRDYYEKIGIFTGVLEAVSGGIDSALGTAIAYDAVGPELVRTYNLPSQHNSEQTQQAAKQLAANFDLDFRVIPIQDIVDQMLSVLEYNLSPLREELTLENLQARVRGLIMMAESNERQALLLTNGNETEIALGYSTLYGDMVGGLAVIGDLSKPDVYRLARHVNRKWGRAVIPEETFAMPATAELKADQTDPFDYPVVGPIVSDFVERGASPATLTEAFRWQQLDPNRYPDNIYDRYSEEEFSEMLDDLYRRLNASVYKRMQAAPIVVVTDRAFGFDLRETIINKWEG